MKQALVLYGATELGPPHFSGDMLWRTGFKAPDPFFTVEVEGKLYLFTSALEFERATKEARADKIILLRTLAYDKENKIGIIGVLKDYGVTKVIVPHVFPYEIGKVFEKYFEVEVRRPPFYPERAKKTDLEISEIEKAQRAVEVAVKKAMEFLKECRIDGDLIYFENLIVTSELLRKVIDDELYARGFLGIDTIVASGREAADPHCMGYGQLYARSPIVLDVFPLSLATHYYADQTRTVFKGEPSWDFKRMYETVLDAQLEAIEEIKAGIDGRKIYDLVVDFFTLRGYPTANTKQRPKNGFIHGVGHGVGIDIHEPPRIDTTNCLLEERNVVTVEPGLYYSTPCEKIPVGGIRIEDMVVVTNNGCRNLTKFPKELEDMIIP